MSTLSRLLTEDSIKLVRLLWCDNANLIRSKAFHIAAMARYKEKGIGLTTASQGLSVISDAICPDTGLCATGENWLKPDWQTLKILNSPLANAAVVADIVERNGKPWPLCPRFFLKRMLSKLPESVSSL